MLEPPLVVVVSASGSGSDTASVVEGEGSIVFVSASLTSWVAIGSTLSVEEVSSVLVVEGTGSV